MKLIIAGDFAPKNRLLEQIKEKKFKDIFSDDLLDAIKSTDFSIVNLECPIADDNFKPIPKSGPNLKCTSNAVDALQYAGFSVVTMANNHILDYGEDGLNLTLEYCKKAGLQTVGVGSNLREAQKTLYVSKVGQTLAVINCCEHEFSIATETTGGANSLDPISQYYAIIEAKKNADYVLVIVHGGHEHYQLPSIRMQDTYRFFIDAGADAVVNHHQHCYSGYEVYKDKPIFYGIGNFAFDIDRYRNSFWNEGFLVQLDFSSSKVEYKLIPYIQYSEKPSVDLCTSEQNKDFERKIKYLNKIITNRNLLQESNEKYYSKSSSYELSILEPYQGRLFSKLFSMGLLPKFVKRKKIPVIFNHINCESHRDKLIYALNSRIKGNKL